ncbi:hypothetical protein JXA70_05375 [candidate division KSB1 bacterium]|nr:hypothetical protein [candidate division KSB1 bacterium]
MKQPTGIKLKQTLWLFSIITFCAVFVSCDVGLKNIVGDEKGFVINYKGPSAQKWIQVKDADDRRKLADDRLSILNLDILKYPYTVESMVVHSRFMLKRKFAGISVVRINIPPELNQRLLEQSITECEEFTQSAWFNKTVSFADIQYVQYTEGKEFFIAERSDRGLKDILALVAQSDGVYLFSFYAPKNDFDEEYGKIFRSMLTWISFDKAQIEKAYAKTVAGFFTGIWHGLFWLLRWFYSLGEYYDVWPDRHSGFGYISGFTIGITLAILSTLLNTGSRTRS